MTVTVARVVWICRTFDNDGKKECASKQIPDEALCAVTAEVIGSAEFDAELFEELIEKIIVPQSNRLQRTAIRLKENGKTVHAVKAGHLK